MLCLGGKHEKFTDICLGILSLMACCAVAAESARPLRPVNTYSIVARDPDSGEIGAAVQSHWFSVGSIVIWAEPGVGAVATQSFVEPTYGHQIVEQRSRFELTSLENKRGTF